MGYYIEILVPFFSLILLFYLYRNKNGLPTNWPIVGMLPAILVNLHRIHDYATEALEKVQLTFFFKGPWFTNMQFLVTIDPANVHHIMSKKFGNYIKGPKFNEIFDVLGEGIFNTDSNLWQYHRKLGQTFMNHPNFHQCLIKSIQKKVEGGLIPVLDHVSKHGLEVDLQDLLQRFTFDNICTIIMDYDPRSLSIDFPEVAPCKALHEIEEVCFYRFTKPTCIWKFQRWLDVGLENKHRQAWKVLDDFIYKCISQKEDKKMSKISSKEDKDKEVMAVDLLDLYMNETKRHATTHNNGQTFVRDTFLTYFFAGKDSTSVALSWFFYLLSKNPLVLSKIKEELDEMIIQATANYTHANEGYKFNYLSKNFEELSEKLVYLHCALCETLRLYPPLVFEAKAAIESDILPSGHRVDPNAQILFNLYAMGRMKSIWGDDCNEFKPERWILEKGKIRHEPSYKFLAFNAGPRTCLGKNMAFIQMKAIAAIIIQNYHIQPVEGYPVIPDLSIILRMKHGFKVKVQTI